MRFYFPNASGNLLPSYQRWLLAHGSRERIIEWLIWNDRNGIYSDEDCDCEGIARLTLETARNAMRAQLEGGV